ncbi:MAG: SDR family oxidoreductase [Meiothermus sp.]|nr:SDR family oxidoreductase [Meiothermus sp.]
MKLRGKTFIVTGASRGLGEALAKELGRAGANLVIGARNKAALEFVQAEVRELGVGCEAVAGSSASAEVAEGLVKAAVVLGGFAGFVHNAGIVHPGPLVFELAEAAYHEVVESNLTGGYQLARFAYPQLMRQGEGVAVFVGSGLAEHHLPGTGLHGAAKAAEEYLARQLALEAPEITCWVYRPGLVETEMQRQLREAEGGGGEATRALYRAYQRQGQVLTPEQSAAALVRLLEADPRRFHGGIAHQTDV